MFQIFSALSPLIGLLLTTSSIFLAYKYSKLFSSIFTSLVGEEHTWAREEGQKRQKNVF